MKKSLLLLLAGSVLALYSCANKDTAADETPAQVTEEPATIESAAAVNTAEAPVTPPDVSMPGDPPPPPPVAGKSSEPVNPPHGQPGHRCDISVGAPLSSAPNSAAANVPPSLPGPGDPPTTQRIEMPPAGSPPPASIMKAPAPGTSTVTAPGMNPPHGQPGHDCTVAVGAPLKK